MAKNVQPQIKITPEWIEANREAFAAAGFPITTKEDIAKKVQESDTAAKAAKDLLGLDIASAEANIGNEYNLRPLTELMEKLAVQLDLIMQSTQFRGLMTPKERAAIHGARTILRQLRNESAPAGQAATLRELIGTHSKLADGVLNDRAKPVAQAKKQITLSPAHLQQAGVLE